MGRAQVFVAKIVPGTSGVTRSGKITAASVAILVLSSMGCSKEVPAAAKSHLRPEVSVVVVEKRSITRKTGHPGYVEDWEQTAIYPRIAGYVDYWEKDIDDVVKKGDVLVHLFVPDLVAEHEEKVAEVELSKTLIQVAEELVKVADEDVKTAKAKVDEADANVKKNEAEVEFYSADYDRIHKLYLSNSLDALADTAAKKHKLSSIAGKNAADAGIMVAKAVHEARKADYKKANIDVAAAIARHKVALAAEKRLAALVGFSVVTAPYDGRIVIRNVNEGDYVQPASGDPSAAQNNPGMSRTGSHPLYVLAKTDKARIFLDVSEKEANGIHNGTKADITIQAVDNMMILDQKVKRTSSALNPKSRTLRVEIDVPNPDRKILPNMYAYGMVDVTRSNVLAIPVNAKVRLGNDDCCYVLADGKAVKMLVQLGIDDGVYVEVIKKLSGGKWVDFDRSEQILVGDFAQLSDGEPVRVVGSAPAAK